MLKIGSLLVVVMLLALAGCGDAGGSSAARDSRNPAHPATLTMTADPADDRTVDETARAYIEAWEAEDSAAMERLLTPDARAAWALGGGMSKRLLDKQITYGSPVAGQGRVLALEEHGGSATADVGVVYECLEGCYRYDLPDWPPLGSAASADRLTLQRQADGRWLISYLDGSPYLDDLVKATRVVSRGATHTAAAASWQKTKTAMPRQTPLPTRTPLQR